jgi:hypothetical protein
MYSGRLHVGGLLERVTFGCFSSLSAGLYNCLIRFLFKFHAAMELAYVFLQLSLLCFVQVFGRRDADTIRALL